MMRRTKLAALAFGYSLLIYFIPIEGPHASWLLGGFLFQAVRSSTSWMAVSWAVALTFQFMAGAAFFSLLRRPSWTRAILPLLALVFAFVVLPPLMIGVIPALLLEEPDTTPETISWPVVCTATGVSLTDLRTPTDVWVRYSSTPNDYAVLSMPGCHLAPVKLPQPAFKPDSPVDFSADPAFVIRGGRAIVRKYETTPARQSWWLIPAAPMENRDGMILIGSPAKPILSTDGQCAAWIEVIPPDGRPVFDRVVIQRLDEPRTQKTIDLTQLGPDFYSLKRLDVENQEITLWKRDHLLTIGFDGAVRKTYQRPAIAQVQENTYIAMGDFWLAWDAVRESGRYVVEWSLPSGSGSHRIPSGRTIHSAAVDRLGKWIAVSIGTNLNVGTARDAIFVLRASDGHEVFHKYLPRHNRTPVAFLDGGYLVFSDSTGVQVLQVPWA